MRRLAARAPGKVNLCLLLGPARPDGLHELVSVIEPLSLADELTLTLAAGDEDEVDCPGVEGPNLAAAALAAFRAETGWDGPPVRLAIDKRVPVAAGMGGGSGDAAAALRLAAEAAGRPGDPVLARIAPRLGADVPSQLAPGPVLVTGAGERVEPLPGLPPHAVLVLPAEAALSTPEVFREADRLALGRDPAALAAAGERVAAAARRGELPPELMVNDLQPAAISLCPAIEPLLADARAAGADMAMVSGSGPTVVGFFLGPEGPAAAGDAAAALAHRHPRAVAAVPVDAAWAAARAR